MVFTGIDSFSQDITKPDIKNSKKLTSKKIIESLLYAIEIMPRSSVNIVLTDFNMHELDNIFNFIVDNKIDKVEILELIEHDFRNNSSLSSPGPKFTKIIKDYSDIINKITYNPILAKYICYLTNGLMVQFADDFCTRRVCQNLWTRIDASENLVPCIKSDRNIRINFDRPLADQVLKSNNMMCNYSTGNLPRDSRGNILGDNQAGNYYKPILLPNIIIDNVVDP